MSNLPDIITNATTGQYFAVLVVLLGVYGLLSVIGVKPRGTYWLFYKRPRFPRLWSSAAWLFLCATALSVYEFYAVGSVMWPDEVVRSADKYARSAYSYVVDEVQALRVDVSQQVTSEVPEGAIAATVTYVTDGDTVKVSTSEGKLTIRLQGIDAPEKNQRYGKTSTRALKGLLTSTIYLDVDGKDCYSRTIATLYRDDGVNINASMVCAGHAWWYKRYAPTNSELSSCQGYAIENELGLWKGYDPIPPWEFRRGVR